MNSSVFSSSAAASTRALASRILGNLGSFQTNPLSDSDPSNNLPIGTYHSQDGDKITISPEYITVTEQGIVVPFRSIRSVKFPKKSPIAGNLIVELDDGSRVQLRILDGDQRIRDVYEFGRFVMRAAEAHRGVPTE